MRQSLTANPADFALTARQAAQSDTSAIPAADNRRVLLVVTTIAFATSSTVQLWDMATSQPIGDPIAPNDGTIFNLAFSLDGGTLATGGADGTVRLWNV